MAIQREALAEALRDRYQLVRELGRGGMATVWLAQDLRHDRPVALKLLFPELAASLGPERFLREIHTAGRLQHPHILPVLDSGQAPVPTGPDLLWYTMPYVEGETLRERLRRERQLPVDEALRIGQEIALALDHAHRHGVIHRDVKPENILLADQALLADFGIARALSDEGRITETGMALGTPAYMSPEQASATQELDGRSDIYSLGCVLYEMLAGEAPHSAPSAQAIIGRRLSEPAPPVGRARPAASEEVERTVATALAPIPADRFRTAGEMAEALDGARRHGRTGARAHWIGTARRRRVVLLVGVLAALAVGTFGVRMLPRRAGAPAGGEESARLAGAAASEDPRPSVAVLPLVNLSPDRENEYFSDGMTEELITALGKVEGLRVAARTSAFAFKGKEADVREIGAKLNVGTVLEGSVRRSGRRLRLNAQLVSTKDGYHLWSEEYDRELADVFAVQDDLARAIVGALRVTLQRPAGGSLVKPPTADLEAHDLYLQGRFLWNQRTYESMPEAARSFDRAIARDPGYAEAYAGLAETYVLFPIYGVSPAVEAYPRARSAALRALALDSTLGNAHATLGVVRELYEYDWAGAEQALRRAIVLDPGYATAHQWYAEYLSLMGRDAEARREAERAVALDPLSTIIRTDQAQALVRGRHLDEAIALLRRVLETSPDFPPARNTLGWAYAAAGQFKPALVELQTTVRLSHGRNGQGRMAYVYGRLGRSDTALAITRSLIERFHRERIFAYSVALGYVGTGDVDRALDWLERAADVRDPNIPLYLRTDPVLDPLRTNARFKQLLRRVGLE